MNKSKKPKKTPAKRGHPGAPNPLSSRREIYKNLRIANPEMSHTECARQAGYKESSAHIVALRLERNPLIADAIKEASQKAEDAAVITREQIIEELAKLALANAGDYFDWDEHSMCLVPKKDLTPEQMAAISEITQTTTKDGGSLKMKLHDKKGALDSLARIFGMNKDNLHVSGVKALIGVDIDQI